MSTRKTKLASSQQDAGQRRVRVTALRQQLSEWEQSADPEEVARVVAHFTGYGRGYSERNAKLIATQRPDATEVAGFREWKLRGRVVRKGEHGIKILAPSKYGRAEASKAGDAESASARREENSGEDDVRFVFVTVFDISQTEPLADGQAEQGASR
jgi:antirestriction protein ArdC